MKLIATYDIGTTAVKGVLVTVQGEAVFSKKIDIDTYYNNGFVEQNPIDWYNAFCTISKTFMEQYCQPDDVIGIVMSGQMQDVVLVDKHLNALGNAILYSDNRAEKQAKRIISDIGEQEILRITGNSINGATPIAKLRWIKDNQPDMYDKAHKVLFCAKDFCIAKLTGRFVGDVTAASTSGIMNIHTKKWWDKLASCAQLERHLLPQIGYAHQKAGVVCSSAEDDCMFSEGTPVYFGTGDAGATTLASGINNAGEFNINIGTSGWVACVDNNPLLKEGVFNLAAMKEETYITVVPFLNAGNVHNWITKVICPDEVSNKYDYIGTMLETRVCGSGGLMFLPYLVGERFPIMDGETKGCFIGATPSTSKADMVSACLEGVAFSIRQGIDMIGIPPNRITLIGGGARVLAWCQIFADVLNVPIEVCGQSEYLPAMSIASSVLIDKGIFSSYDDFGTFAAEDIKVINPISENVRIYDNVFSKYKKIYPAVKELFI